MLLRPPIPDEFYLTPAEKENNKELNVVFMGRLDPEKGINDVIRLFEHLGSKKGLSVAIHGYTWNGLAESVDIHRYLNDQDTIAYSSCPHREYDERTQSKVRDVLRTADVIVLPYREFNRTLDPPLILLEAMASLCIPITCPVGTISGLIHRPDCLISADTFFDDAEKRILAIQGDIHQERQDLFDWNQHFSELRASEVASRFIESISCSQRRIA